MTHLYNRNLTVHLQQTIRGDINVYLVTPETYLVFENSRIIEKKDNTMQGKQPQIEPFITFPFVCLNQLANAFANIGIYPDKFKPYENELSATKYHLEGLRQILKIKKE